jgi:hypothetical protein
MELDELVSQIRDISAWAHTDLVKLFAWHLHTAQQSEQFDPKDIRGCYESLNIEPPVSINSVLQGLEKKKPKEVLRSAQGYRLEKRIRDKFDAQYARRPTAVHVDRLLSELPSQIPNLAEKAYLNEALICFRYGAFRAAVVMCWNLAFDHLCQFVLTDSKRLSDFNAQLPRSFPRADISSVSKRDDFNELKEYQVLQVCKSANIISGSVHKVLKEKLDRRNITAHPSGISTSQLTAEEFIKDLVENVVLKLQ